MYIAELTIENFRCFGGGDKKLTLPLRSGLTALVGENDAGKSAVIDALRFVLGTRDQEYIRVEDDDFHRAGGANKNSKEIHIRCKFDGLTISDKGAFAEYLTYEERDDGLNAVLFINWTAKDALGARGGRRFISVEVKSGKAGDGPPLDAEVRSMLRATYLRPLRDAGRAMSAGRRSRLSQILQHTQEVRECGDDFDEIVDPTPAPDALSVLGVGDYASFLLANHEGIRQARERLNKNYLKPLSFSGDDLIGHIGVNPSGDKNIRLRQLLEKLELELKDGETHLPGNRGLGSNNLLFMACELLLLGSEGDFPLLLIEEPEAHLHPQRQLRLMQFLQNQAGDGRADGEPIQIIVTTHSPNLTSVIRLESLVMIQGHKAFPLSVGKTQLSNSDYRFLERFLDVTKANLFFARGVMIVEGDGENLLLPALARLIKRDFAEHGVSMVNVGHTGLRRFARILQRKEPERDGEINLPVACVADLDVMPDCAPVIIGKVKESEEWPGKGNRKWRVKSDFTEEELDAHREKIQERASGQNIASFVADEWTLEYDLAYSGLAEDVWVAAHLAKNDDKINDGSTSCSAVEAEATASFDSLSADKMSEEEIASRVYALFTAGATASKAITAQYLSARLERRVQTGDLTVEGLEAKLPRYLVSAIKHVTRTNSATTTEERHFGE